jgi:hypothetical protein
MILQQLHEFFINDDSARMKSFAWSVAAGTLCGSLAHFLLGATEMPTGIVTGLGTTCGLTLFLVRYISVPYRSKKLARAVSGRRSLIKLSLASVAEVTFAGIGALLVNDVNAALVYARAVDDDIRAQKKLSLLRVMLARQAVTNALAKSTSASEYSSLYSAYVVLSAAENYYQVQDERPHEYNGVGTVEVSHPTYRILGLTMISGVPLAPPYRRPNAIKVLQQDAIVVIQDCTIINFRQKLGQITWINVIFKNCSLEATVTDLLLVNVSFIDCSIWFPPEEANTELARELRSGTAQGVTFSSQMPNLGKRQ